MNSMLRSLNNLIRSLSCELEKRQREMEPQTWRAWVSDELRIRRQMNRLEFLELGILAVRVHGYLLSLPLLTGMQAHNADSCLFSICAIAVICYVSDHRLVAKLKQARSTTDRDVLEMHRQLKEMRRALSPLGF